MNIAKLGDRDAEKHKHPQQNEGKRAGHQAQSLADLKIPHQPQLRAYLQAPTQRLAETGNGGKFYPHPAALEGRPATRGLKCA